MQDFLNYIIANYTFFLTVSIVLIFALIGYFVDEHRKKNNPFLSKQKEEINLEQIQANGNVGLNAAMDKNSVSALNSPVNMGGSSTVDSLMGKK